MKKTHLAAGNRQIRLFEDAGRNKRLAGADALSPPKIQILVVIDGHASSFHNASFSPSPYGLSSLLDCMTGQGEYFVEFEVTRAHRQTDPFRPDAENAPQLSGAYAPHYEDFRFDQQGFDLADFDQVWLFGIRAGLSDPRGLSDGELEILVRWMDQGGGVFATGGPDDLGSALAGRIPRVRSMRRWGPMPQSDSNIFYLDSGPNSQGPSSWPREGISNLRTGKSGRVMPKHYPQLTWSPYSTVHAPHPVLWSPDGAIEGLPVHPRQSEVLEEADINFTAEFSVGGYRSQPEFPSALAGGPRPEVIAWATGAGASMAPNPTPVSPVRPFGAVGVYDGHKALGPKSGCGIGRIVVDSSWRHWFDSYHQGSSAPSARESLDGVTPSFVSDSPSGADPSIGDYYHNIALWLAPPAVQRTMLLHAIWGGVTRSPLVEDLNLRQTIWQLGARTREAIGNRVNLCMLRDWLQDLFPSEVLDPWRRIADDDTRTCLISPPLELLEVSSLGGIVREMLSLATSFEQGKLPELNERSLAAALVKGAEYGLIELLKIHGLSRGVTDQLMGNLREALDRLPSDESYVTPERTAPPIREV